MSDYSGSAEYLPTISACIIHLNDSESLTLCLKSILPFVDEVIIIDGGSEPRHLEAIDKFDDCRIKVIHHKWLGWDSFQRDQYLKYASKDWILVIDSDECLSDNAWRLKEVAQECEKNPSLPKIYDIRMIHYIYHLYNVDTTVPVHYVPRRFFKNMPGLYYDYTRKHGSIIGNFSEVGRIDDVVIHHYSHVKGLLHSVRWKYEDNIRRSEMHTPDFMAWWRKNLLSGTYPTGNLNPMEHKHPSVIQALIDEESVKGGNKYLL